MLQGLAKLWRLEVYALAVMKKRMYWPNYCPGKVMDQRLSSKEEGDTDYFEGKLDDIDHHFLQKRHNMCSENRAFG